MRILVTGGSSFIGRAVVARLYRAHEVYCLLRDPGSAPPGGIPIAGDLSASLDVASWPAVDGVVHLAQATTRRPFPEGAIDIFAVNVAGLARLLDAATRLGIGRFVIASTGTIYEDAAPPLTEDLRLAPRDYYPATKLAAETLLPPYEAGMAVCALRLFTPYGPGQTGRLVPDLIDRVRTGRPITLVGSDEGHLLAPTFVDDVAEVFGAAAEQGWRGTFNVAAPQVLSVREIGVVLGRALGKEPHFERQPGEARRLFPDLTKLANRYPLSRFRSFDAGLRDTLAT
jgi:nucleoside-diphosphate-sugar epimerase